MTLSLAPTTALCVGRVVIIGETRVHAPVAIEIEIAGRRERLTGPDFLCRFKYVKGALVYDAQRE